jgi:hypothetical protein
MMGDKTKVTVTFDRIGRNHNVAPLVEWVTGPIDPDALAEGIYHYARPHLASRDIEVAVDLDKGQVFIFAGFNNGGGGTIAVEED